MLGPVKATWHQYLKVATEYRRLHVKPSPISIYLISKILKNLSLPNHDKIRQSANTLIAYGDFSGYFYLALSFFLQNDLARAEECLQIFSEKYPYNPEGCYLFAQIEVLTNRKINARQRLIDLIEHSSRRKTWQHLSNLVDTSADFEGYRRIFESYHPNYDKEVLPYDLICHLSNAAQRGGRSDFALALWRSQYQIKQRNHINIPKLSHNKGYNDRLAANALRALKQCFDASKIDFFLISGTLLGCIREGKLLGHDKDIDVGVWDAYTIAELAQTLRCSGCFYVMPNYSPDILAVRHVNGITIDIFIHYREPNDYWHAGGKSSWHNSPFELVYHNFLGERYLIPKDYDLYLTENYGADWRVPKIDFDSALDTPNMRVASNEKMLIYFYKKLFALDAKTSPGATFRMESKISTLQTQDMG